MKVQYEAVLGKIILVAETEEDDRQLQPITRQGYAANIGQGPRMYLTSVCCVLSKGSASFTGEGL